MTILFYRGPNDTIEIQYSKNKKINEIYIDYKESKLKNKNNKKIVVIQRNRKFK